MHLDHHDIMIGFYNLQLDIQEIHRITLSHISMMMMIITSRSTAKLEQQDSEYYIIQDSYHHNGKIHGKQ